MRVNVGHLLRQAGHAAGNRYGYKYALEELADNLKELRDRSRRGDGQAALNDFFSVYVFGDGQSSTSGTAPTVTDGGPAEAGHLTEQRSPESK